LVKELGLKALEPPKDTFKQSNLNLALISKNLVASLDVSDITLSDHFPLSLKVQVKIINKKEDKIFLPNRKLLKK